MCVRVAVFLAPQHQLDAIQDFFQECLFQFANPFDQKLPVERDNLGYICDGVF